MQITKKQAIVVGVAAALVVPVGAAFALGGGDPEAGLTTIEAAADVVVPDTWKDDVREYAEAEVVADPEACIAFQMLGGSDGVEGFVLASYESEGIEVWGDVDTDDPANDLVGFPDSVPADTPVEDVVAVMVDGLASKCNV